MVRLSMWLKTYSLIVVTILVANTDAFLISRFRLPPYNFKQGIQTRVAHFPAGKRETGNGYREISRREMTVFPGNFPVLTKIGLKWAKNGQNLTNLAS